MMKPFVKVAFLSSITTAALVYVFLEWRPLGFTTSGVPAPAEPTVVSTAAAPAPLAPQDFSADERNNIEVYEKYSPGVVNITSTTISFDFFLRPYPTQAGTGSGAIIDREGHIVTNYHVVEGARRLEVTLADKTRYPATVVGVDANNDVAVLQIDAPRNKLAPIPLGTTRGLQVGQKVLAIGNPFGLEGTLTTGIISSLGRSIQAPNGRVIEDVIQTDAAINPGNSGGPLLNSRGEIIGINTAILSPADTGNIGIGFAIPADTVRRITNDLITLGRVRRPYLGVEGIALAQYPGLAEVLNLSTETGLMVIRVVSNSPAAVAGIRGSNREVIVGNYRVPTGGDIIVAIDGREVNTQQDLSAAIERFRPGDRVTVTVIRGDRRLDVPVVLQERPSN